MDKPMSFYAFEILYWCGIREGELIMSLKNLDSQGRWRNKTIAFRVSQEEDAQLERFVRLSGLTKQDYITRRLLCQDVVVQGNPRVYKALRDQLAAVLDELRRIASSSTVNSDLLDTINMIAAIMGGMKRERIREVSGEKYIYANDYEIIARMKEFADKHSICLLLVHHTRKQTADDKFDMISGTTGLLGAADGAFLLQKKKRTSNAATLEVSGRDQPDQKLYISRDPETLQWELEEAEVNLWKEPPEPILERIATLFGPACNRWVGSATDLCSKLNLNIRPNVLTMKLNVNAGRLLKEYGIYYNTIRTHYGREVYLWTE